MGAGLPDSPALFLCPSSPPVVHRAAATASGGGDRPGGCSGPSGGPVRVPHEGRQYVDRGRGRNSAKKQKGAPDRAPPLLREYSRCCALVARVPFAHAF